MRRGYTNNYFQPRRRGNIRNYRARGYRHTPYRAIPSYNPGHEKDEFAYNGEELERIDSRFLFKTEEETKNEVGTQTDGIVDIRINQLSQELLKKNTAIRSHDVTILNKNRKP